MGSNLKKQIWLFIGIIIIAGSFYSFFSSPRIVEGDHVVIDGTYINVELAQTDMQRAQGLSGHKPLASNEGMLFFFAQPGQYGFWMKDMLFPIDIMWISADKKIVHIEHDLSPETYPQVFTPKEQAQYVLEVSAGLTDKNKWREGDQVKF
jgi:hypothetical protein